MTTKGKRFWKMVFVCGLVLILGACVDSSDDDAAADDDDAAADDDDAAADDDDAAADDDDAAADDDLTTLDSAEEVATVVAIGAGGLSDAGGAAAPTVQTLLLGASRLKQQISGFTFDAATGVWTGTTQNGATPSLRFYRGSNDSLITVDVTDQSNYQPGGELFGVTPFGQTGSGVSMIVTVEVQKTFEAGYTVEMTAQTLLIVTAPQNIGASASYDYAADSGTITGAFGTITMEPIIFTAEQQGATVNGEYGFSVTQGEVVTYSGSVFFDQDGCSGVIIADADGNELGEAWLNDSGQLIFTDAATGETTEISRKES